MNAGRITLAVAVALLPAGMLTSAPAASAAELSVTFTSTGAAQTWNVPTGVQTVSFQATGGFGGGIGAPTVLANMLSGSLTIPTGASALEINVGGNGANQSTTGAGGWNGGGSGGGHSGGGMQVGAGGGGATDIRLPGAAAYQALVVAGGGGGFGGNGTNLGSNWFGSPGGFGGLQPQAGTQGTASGSGSDGGAGGAGGAVPGALGGAGENSSNGDDGAGGGGGGGWNSGAGGGAGQAWKVSLQVAGGGGGGGGQSYASSNVVGAAEIPNGGQFTPGVTITYLTVTNDATSTMPAGAFASWTYDAGSGATYSVESGSLPPGMTLDGSTGIVSGTPLVVDTYTFTVAASKFVFVPGKAAANEITTNATTTVSVTASGPGELVATTATDITGTTATANGVATGVGAPVTGLNCVYQATSGGPILSVPATPSSAPAGLTPTSVSCPLTGLVSGQQYTYYIDGMQGNNSLFSTSKTFTTNSTPPSVTTNPATSVTSSAATGNGTLTSTQSVAAIQCRYATTAAGVATGSAVAASPSSTGVVTDQALTCAMTGLSANQHYYYAFFADATTSPSYGHFVTRVAPPALGLITASNVGTSSATITGSVSATNENVTSIYCRAVPSPGDPGNGSPVTATPFTVLSTAVDTSVTCPLSGLSSGTTYVARMYATDADGTSSSGNKITFTTSTPAPPSPGPGPSPATDTTSSTPASTSTTTTPSTPTTPQAPPTVLRPIAPGIYAVLGSTTQQVKRPVADRKADAPIVHMPINTSISLAVRGLPLPGTMPVWVKGTTGPWRWAGTTTVNEQGRATLPALLVSEANTYYLRIGGARPKNPPAHATYLSVVVRPA